MVKLICEPENIHPVSKILRDCGLINCDNIHYITIPYNGWFCKYQIVGRIDYVTGNNIKENVPVENQWIPERIRAYRDLKTCTTVANELEKAYNKEITVEFKSKDYYSHEDWGGI